MSETTTETLPTDVIEQISAAVHEQWMATKHAQGVTSRLSESGEELMVPYPELSEMAKDLDRGSVTAVLGPAYPLIAEQIRVEERRRVAGLIRKNAATLDSFAREGSTAGLIAYLIDNVMAAPEGMGGAVLIEPGRPDQDGRDLGTGRDGHVALTSPAARTSQPVPSDESVCHRCGGKNCVWSAPSPLWNEVMRGGDINGPWKWNEIICPPCFAELAEAAGIAATGWRFTADTVLAPLTTVTPEGRVWDESKQLWVEPTATPTEPVYDYCENGLHSIHAGSACPSYPCNDAARAEDLPGMWDQTDFTGGATGAEQDGQS